MTKEQKSMMADAIKSHIRVLYNEFEAYTKNGNKEAAKECLQEVKKYQKLQKEIRGEPVDIVKVLNDTNKKLKKFFKNYQIEIHGDFSDKYNEVRLTYNGSCFPICYVETIEQVAETINAYMTGLAHGDSKSYVKLCDKNKY